MQVFVTIISGVTIYLFGQLAMQFVLEPIRVFNGHRADTIYFLYRFMSIIEDQALDLNPSDRDGAKEMDAALMYAVGQIPFYDRLCRVALFNLPNKAAIFDATHKFTLLAKKSASKTLDKSDIETIGVVASLLKADLIARPA